MVNGSLVDEPLGRAEHRRSDPRPRVNAPVHPARITERVLRYAALGRARTDALDVKPMMETRAARRPSSRHLEHHELPEVVELAEPIEMVTMAALATVDELERVQRLPGEVGQPAELESRGG